MDVNVVLADVLGLLEHQFATHRIKVRKELSEEPALVSGMEHKLQQVFLNLFLNAKDAMPKGGWLSVRTAVEPERVMVELADTGGGIPSEHLSRIYDPFFTTKTMNQGTGPRAVDHLRDRARARRHHRVRQHGGAGHALRAVVPGRRRPAVCRRRPVLSAAV